MNNKDMLSQEEIDALLNNEADDNSRADPTTADEFTLTDFEIDAIGEIGNITFGSASTALSTILGKKVEITTPQVELVAADKLDVKFPVPHTAISVSYTEGFSGTNMLVIKKMDAAIIADLMMGGDGQNVDDTLSEMHTSAVQEAMNQMMGSAATSMSTIFDTTVNISPPTVAIIDFSESEQPQHELEDEMLVKVAFRLTVGDLIDSYIMQLLPITFAKEMTTMLAATTAQAEVSEATVETAATAVVEELEASPLTEQQPQQTQPPVSPVAEPSLSTGANRVYAEQQQPAQPVRQQPPKEVQMAQFAPLTGDPDDSDAVNFDLFMDIPLQVTVELGRTEKSIEELLSISPGSIIELDKLAGEPVDILVNQKRIAQGEVVVVDENFGVRVTDIFSKKGRLEQLR